MKSVFVSGEAAEEIVESVLGSLHAAFGFSEVIIRQGQNELAIFAQAWADKQGIPTRPCEADWDTSGAVNLLVAFPGADEDIRRADEARIKVARCGPAAT